ncbi:MULTISPECIES: hypothetical protein [Micromonospora]|uniref:hypothetical protein n=1 Tax=Micromonospora TaxID=1873 RepID=UPI001FD3C794|nr:hypothetical protein [Micromonospora tulbaghiae]
MTTVVVSLVVLLVLVGGIIAFLDRRQRNQLASDVDSTASRQAASDKHRHDAKRHLASGISERNKMPDGGIGL